MTTIVLGAKILTFFMTFGGLLGHVEPVKLFNLSEANPNIYATAADDLYRSAWHHSVTTATSPV